MFQREFTLWLLLMIEALWVLKFFLFMFGPMLPMPLSDIKKFLVYTFSTEFVFLIVRFLLLEVLFIVPLKLLAGDVVTRWAFFFT